ESITGQCETLYDISPLPENVIRSKPALAPILNNSPKLLNVIDVVKISNFSNCKRHLVYHRGINGKKNWDAGFSNVADVIHRKTEGRLIINGTLQDYTIHSTTIEDKIFVAPSLYKKTKGLTLSCVNLTLVHIEKSELPLLLNFEINSTLSFDYEYKSNGNIDITSGSFNNEKDKDSENKIRSARHVNFPRETVTPPID
ncbi:Vitellogenin-A1, partial [Gryllus bimaculatus]